MSSSALFAARAFDAAPLLESSELSDSFETAWYRCRGLPDVVEWGLPAGGGAGAVVPVGMMGLSLSRSGGFAVFALLSLVLRVGGR